MNKPFDGRDPGHVVELLRATAEGIATLAEPAPLVERVLNSATDSFFSVDSPIGAVYAAVGPDGVRYVAPAGSPEEFVRGHRERFGRLVSPASEDRIAVLAGNVEVTRSVVAA